MTASQKKDAAAPTAPAYAVPFLKFAGGKRQLLPEIRKHVPRIFGNYFEPFVGGGAVFFDLQAAGRLTGKVWLGDVSKELVWTYKAVRDHVDDVIERLHIFKGKHSEAHYYRIREIGSNLPIRALAARMIYLNRTGFNGLYRLNKKGGFNVPFGRYENPTICDEENLRACARALKDVEVVAADFMLILSQVQRGDFVYMDPPYVPVSPTSNFTGYTAGGFNLADQERLVVCAKGLKKLGVKVLLSNADLPLVRNLYKGFEMRSIPARRNINSKGGKRGAVAELLIW